jgi:hydrogenase maturation factor
MGWYLVQVNSNDIATTGGRPRWLMLTMLLPEGETTPELVSEISEEVYEACREMDIMVIGGHTEITHGLQRPLLIGTLIGEVPRDKLITPKGLCPGDRLLLTKGVPIEATAILANDFPDRLQNVLTKSEIAQAQHFLHKPGISILRDAQIAISAGKVTAMHDPTEGGLAAALWELAEASGLGLMVDATAVVIPPLSAQICTTFGLDPMATIASGALLLSAPPEDVFAIQKALAKAEIACTEIGIAITGPTAVWQKTTTKPSLMPRPNQDEIGRVYVS